MSSKSLQMVKSGALRTSLNAWKSMPKANKTPKGYTLTVNGAELKDPQVMLTGGGAHPAYTYILLNNEVKWFAGHFESGTAVEVIDPTPVEQPKAAAQPAQAPAQAQPEQPKQPKSNKK